MDIDLRDWDTMTCVNLVSEPDHPIILVFLYDYQLFFIAGFQAKLFRTNVNNYASIYTFVR